MAKLTVAVSALGQRLDALTRAHGQHVKEIAAWSRGGSAWSYRVADRLQSLDKEFRSFDGRLRDLEWGLAAIEADRGADDER